MLLDQTISLAAKRWPDRLAVEGVDGGLTYVELDRLAGRVACALLETGLTRGARVALFAEKGVRAVAVLLGVARAGGIYVPIDPQSPPRRAALIVRESGAHALAVSPSHWEAWKSLDDAPAVACVLLMGDGGGEPSSGGSIARSAGGGEAPTPATRRAAGDATASPVLLSWNHVEAHEGVAPLCPSQAGEAAYILFTSGSTGVPKGVALSHENALAFAEGAADLVGLTDSDRVFGLAPLHFDLSVFDLYATFLRGATAYLAPEWALLAPDKLIDRIGECGSTVMYSVPSIFRLLMKTGGFTAERLPSLKTLIYAGEPFPVRGLRELMTAFPGRRVYNFFGPTETNVCLSCPVETIPSDDADEVPIGWPCCGARVVLRDDAGRIAEDIAEGELLVDGPTVMLGYWKDGRVAPAARPYATGDRVVRRPDGAYLFRGRRDHQVKVQGVRIELGDVEAALCGHPGIREAAVVAVEDRLVAFVVAGDEELSVLAVKRHCAERLSRGMTPRDVRLVQSLPRRSNGKLDRPRLEEEARETGGS